MNSKDTIQAGELLNAVRNYQETVLKASVDYVASEFPCIIRYKTLRRSKLVAVVTGQKVMDEIVKVKETALKLLDEDTSLSENIEVFTLGIVSDSQRISLNATYQELGLSLTLTDYMQMKNIVEFQHLFDGKSEDDTDYDTSLFEYLSMSNETTDAKNSLFYALLLMMVYQNQPVNKHTLEQLMKQKYGKNVGDVTLALKSLRKQGKVNPPGAGDTISLTLEEQAKLEWSLKDEKAKDIDFKRRYEEILEKFGVANGEKIMDSLREAYQAQYQWHSHSDDDERKKEEITKIHFNKIKEAVESQIGDQSGIFIRELRSLCDNSDYLSRYSVSRSFLQLFRSSGYEKYINDKGNVVFLDTPIVTNYLCYLSGKEGECDFEWDNADYQATKSLINMQESEQNSIFFAIPYDYLMETVGELKKALQFSWFDKIELPIPFETGNTFFNFYLAIKGARENKDGEPCRMTFAEFVKELGFEELNPNASFFNKKSFIHMKYFFEKFGSEVISPIHDRYEQFDSVRDTYSIHLDTNGKKKTVMAINSDVRQAFYIAKEFDKDKASEYDYFLASWDKSLRSLRDMVNDELSFVTTYSVMNPANLANKLAFRHFQITKKSVSDDVFAYAENGFNFNTKVQSLFDNVLTPYFANANNKNSALVVTMLKMEKASKDYDNKDEVRIKENTTLADIFLTIVYALPDYDLSTQNLRDFLANEDNNVFIIPLFQEAFDEYAKGNEIDISERFCLHVKEELLKDEEEIKL